MRYKCSKLINGIENLNETRDLGNETCKDSDEVISLIKDVEKRGLKFVAKRTIKEWGFELFFEDNKDD